MVELLTNTDLTNTHLTVEVFGDNLSTTHFRYVALKLEDALLAGFQTSAPSLNDDAVADALLVGGQWWLNLSWLTVLVGWCGRDSLGTFSAAAKRILASFGLNRRLSSAPSRRFHTRFAFHLLCCHQSRLTAWFPAFLSDIIVVPSTCLLCKWKSFSVTPLVPSRCYLTT